MKKNMGYFDRVARVVVALFIVLLYLANYITGAWGIVLMVFAGIFVATSFIGFCPLYKPFGISTCDKPKNAK